MTTPDWHARAAALRPESRAFIAGRFTEAAEGGRFATVNPATGAATAEVAACGAPAMVEAAQRDFVARCALPASAFHADAFTFSHDPAA